MSLKIDLTKIDTFKPEYNFILENDVFSPAGMFIAGAGTRLNARLAAVILEYEGLNIVEIVDIGNCPKEFLADTPFQKFVALYPDKIEEYKEFRDVYKEKELATEQTLKTVVAGGAVDLSESYETITSLIGKLKTKSDVFLYLSYMQGYDIHTFSHSNNVAMLCNIFGTWLGLNDAELKALTISGVFHDIGKTEIPKEIITKPGKLTREEFEIIKGHPQKGYDILKKFGMPGPVAQCALEHHEKTDGSGYPNGVKGGAMSFIAKAVAVCDIYDAMTAKRVYRDKLCPFEVISAFETGMFGALDTELQLIFLKNIAANYINAWLELSNGLDAEVMFIHPTKISRPIVRTADDKFIDLAEQPDIRIVRLKHSGVMV